MKYVLVFLANKKPRLSIDAPCFLRLRTQCKSRLRDYSLRGERDRCRVEARLVARDGEADRGNGCVEGQSQSIEASGAWGAELREAAFALRSRVKDDLAESDFGMDFDLLVLVSAERVGEKGAVSHRRRRSALVHDEGESAIVP